MLRVAALCAGYDGLGLGLQLAGVNHELAWYSEIDPAACTVMEAHTTAPNLGDLCAITNPPPVDIVTAGFPCQSISTAGKRGGINDQRWLIRDVVRVWAASGARWLLLENVAAILVGSSDVVEVTCRGCGDRFDRDPDDGTPLTGLGCPVCGAGLGDAAVVPVRRLWMGEVLRALAEVGASAEWVCVRASDVGAPHRRERWFCVAHTNSARPDESWPIGRVGSLHMPPVHGRNAAPHSDGLSGRLQPVGLPRCCDPVGFGPDRQATPDPNGGGLEADNTAAPRRCHTATRDSATRFGPYTDAVARWERLTRPVPEPTLDGRLNPKFSEWLMGLPDGWVTNVPGLSRAAQLRVIGNGVVPQQCAAAIRQLI